MLNAHVTRGLRALSLCALALGTIGLTTDAVWASETPARADPSWPNAQPAYPATAEASGEQGTVLLDVYVRPSGHISKFRVAQSSGFGDLDQAAAQTVSNWRFVPAIRDGDTVSDWTTVKIVFQLPQPAAATTPPPAR
jgi:protein TonB